MGKRCGFCSFQTADQAAFAAHVSSVHGFGQAPRRAAMPVPPGPITYCYSCGSASPSGLRSCAHCNALLALSPGAHTFGRAYLLNHLNELVASGALDEQSAARVRAALLPHMGGGQTAAAHVAPPIAAPTLGDTPRGMPVRIVGDDAKVVPAARPVPREPAGPGLFSPERAPSLLLYVGAFLVVVSALIFVNVSGEQISNTAKLVLMLVGTVAFLVAGLVCHRIPLVLEAGRTFLLIGALITPLDFAAYYVLIVRASPLSTPEMWILGSAVSAVLYAVLALTAYGRAYAYLCFVAALSALAAVDVRLDLRDGWAFAPFVLLAAAVQLAEDRRLGRVARLTAPLVRASRVLAAVAIVGGIATSVGAAPSAWSLAAIVAAGTVYYGIRSRAGVEWERWLVVAGPAVLAAAAVHDIGGVAQTYGFVFAIVAILYGVAGDVAGLGTPVPLAAWITRRARVVSWFAVAGALLPASAYWRAPLVGTLANGAMAAYLAIVAIARARRATTAPDPARVDLGGFVLAGALALHLGVLFAGLHLGLIKGGIAPFSGLSAREIAVLWAPVTLLLGVAAAVARGRAATLEPSLAIAVLVSSTAVVALAFGDPPLASAFALVAVAGATAGALRAGRPRALWIAAAFGLVAAASLDRWLRPAVEWRPLALSALALALFIPAYIRLRANHFGHVTREIGLATAGLAVIVGLGSWSVSRTPPGVALTELAIWLTTVPAAAVLGGLGVVEALHRRSERGVLVSTVCFLGAVLMLVARVRPEPIEAYSWPVAIYLAAVAWGISRYGSDRLRAALLVPAQVAAAAVLMGSSLAVMPARGEVGRASLVMGEAVLVLRYAVGRASMPLTGVALAFLGAMLLQAIQAPLVLETASAIFGVIVIALALAVPRWVPWRIDRPWLEAAEVVGALLVLAPPLVRATVGAPDALDHGATVLAAGWVVATLAVWRGRRALLGTALVMLSLVALLALRDSTRAEPYVAAAGIALLAVALAVPRWLPRRLPPLFEQGMQVVAVGLILSGALERMFREGGDAPARAIAESLTLVGIGVVAARPALAMAALATVAVEGIWILGDVSARQFHGIVSGAYLMAAALGALRYLAGRIDPRALVAMETGGAFLFIVPTLVAGWGADFFPNSVMVFVEIFIVLAIGVVFRRRWLVAGALAALGLETLRGVVDAVNRLPNWALFGASGALLLLIGFVLLLKREAWNAWSRSMLQWWTRL